MTPIYPSSPASLFSTFARSKPNTCARCGAAMEPDALYLLCDECHAEDIEDARADDIADAKRENRFEVGL